MANLSAHDLRKDAASAAIPSQREQKDITKGTLDWCIDRAADSGKYDINSLNGTWLYLKLFKDTRKIH